MTLTPTLLFLKRREADIMASFPHSCSKSDGHGHGHTSHLLWNRRAEIMATCPPSFSMWEEDDHDPNPPFLKRREAETMASCPPSLPSRRRMGMAMANIILLSGVDEKISWPIAYLPF